jgi:uncharacterized membrane protein (DUF485 family)
MKTVEMREMGVPLPERVRSFPWMLGELVFPLMLEYLYVHRAQDSFVKLKLLAD